MGLELVGLKTIGLGEIMETAAYGVEHRQSVIRADPVMSVLIFPDAEDDIVGQSVFYEIAGNVARGDVETVETDAGADPELSVVVLHS